MALDFKGIEISVSDKKIPAGYIKPVVAKITGEYLSSEETYSIDKNDVEQISAVDGFTELVAKLDELIQTKLNENFKTNTDNFEAYSTFVDFETNQSANSGLYTTDNYTFTCSVKTYILKV